MRIIRRVIVHCSATREDQAVTIDNIRDWHTWPKEYRDNVGKLLYVKYRGEKYNSRDELPEEVRYKSGRGWSDIGYHFFIDRDGILFSGRPVEIAGAHCSGYNSDSIGICYEGGLNTYGVPVDTRTIEQIVTIEKLLKEICDAYSITEIKGHRDYSPDKDNNGKIESWEWIKVCPCYNAEIEHKHLLS